MLPNPVRGLLIALEGCSTPKVRELITGDLERAIRIFVGAWGYDPRLLSATRGRKLATALNHQTFRSVFFYRVGLDESPRLRRALREIQRVWPGMRPLEILCRDIGPGLWLNHGFSTVIAADRIGRDAEINHNVTIGLNGGDGRGPRIGDRVSIYTGAVVVGDITIGDDVRVAANSLVNRDIPPQTIVGGVPAKPIGINTMMPVGL